MEHRGNTSSKLWYSFKLSFPPATPFTAWSFTSSLSAVLSEVSYFLCVLRRASSIFNLCILWALLSRRRGKLFPRVLLLPSLHPLLLSANFSQSCLYIQIYNYEGLKKFIKAFLLLFLRRRWDKRILIQHNAATIMHQGGAFFFTYDFIYVIP